MKSACLRLYLVYAHMSAAVAAMKANERHASLTSMQRRCIIKASSSSGICAKRASAVDVKSKNTSGTTAKSSVKPPVMPSAMYRAFDNFVSLFASSRKRFTASIASADIVSVVITRAMDGARNLL